MSKKKKKTLKIVPFSYAMYNDELMLMYLLSLIYENLAFHFLPLASVSILCGLYNQLVISMSTTH